MREGVNGWTWEGGSGKASALWRDGYVCGGVSRDLSYPDIL